MKFCLDKDISNTFEHFASCERLTELIDLTDEHNCFFL